MTKPFRFHINADDFNPYVEVYHPGYNNCLFKKISIKPYLKVNRFLSYKKMSGSFLQCICGLALFCQEYKIPVAESIALYYNSQYGTSSGCFSYIEPDLKEIDEVTNLNLDRYKGCIISILNRIKNKV